MMIKRRSQTGFTLVEALVVVAILGILSGIAWPLYNGTKMRSRRTDAIRGILAAQKFMEECYNNTRDYTDDSCKSLPANIKSSPNGYYTISLAALATDSYEIQAKAAAFAGNLQAKDTDCAVFSLKSNGNKDGTVNSSNATNLHCWAQ